MMRRGLLIIAGAALAGVWLAQILRQDPGYLLLVWGGYSVEMTFWTGVFLLVLGFIGASLLLALVRGLRHSPRALRRWRHGRDVERSQSAGTRGAIAFAEGRWDRARKLFAQAAQRADNSVIYQLSAARASFAAGDRIAAEQWLDEVAAVGGSAATAAMLTRAELQLAAGQPEQCLATLLPVPDAAVHPAGIKLLLECYRRLGDWEQVKALLPGARRAHCVPAEELHSLELEAYRQLLLAAPGKDVPLPTVEAVWRSMGRTLHGDADLCLAYVAALEKAGAPDRAEAAIRAALKHNWDERLVLYYGKLVTKMPDQQLAQARKWLDGRESDGALLLTLGRLSLANQLWGGAREYFERSLAVRPDPEAYAELGRLLLHLGKRDASLDNFSRGLTRAVESLPELPQPPAALPP